jgi:hypothetical protein
MKNAVFWDVDIVRADVSEESVASIIMVERICEIRTLAVTSKFHIPSEKSVSTKPIRRHTPEDGILDIANGEGLDAWGVGVQVPVESRIFASMSSRLFWGPTQPPIRWVTGRTYPRGSSGRGVNLITRLQLVRRLGNVGLHMHSHICFHGAVLN